MVSNEVVEPITTDFIFRKHEKAGKKKDFVVSFQIKIKHFVFHTLCKVPHLDAVDVQVIGDKGQKITLLIWMI